MCCSRELGRCMWLLERVGSVHVVAQEIMHGGGQYGSVPTNYTKYYVPAKVNNNPRYAFLTTKDKRGLANLTTMKELNYAIFGLSYFER